MNWPSDELRDALETLNREFMKHSDDVELKGKSAWPNRRKELFDEERADATRHEVQVLSPGNHGFYELMNSGLRFNWAISLDGTLRVSLSVAMTADGFARVSHAILVVDDGDVLVAGEGRGGDFLSNATGHYKNPPFVVTPVKQAFAKIGIQFRR